MLRLGKLHGWRQRKRSVGFCPTTFDQILSENIVFEVFVWFFTCLERGMCLWGWSDQLLRSLFLNCCLDECTVVEGNDPDFKDIPCSSVCAFSCCRGLLISQSTAPNGPPNTSLSPSSPQDVFHRWSKPTSHRQHSNEKPNMLYTSYLDCLDT